MEKHGITISELSTLEITEQEMKAAEKVGVKYGFDLARKYVEGHIKDEKGESWIDIDTLDAMMEKGSEIATIELINKKRAEAARNKLITKVSRLSQEEVIATNSFIEMLFSERSSNAQKAQ